MKHLYPYLRRFRKESILAPLFKMLEATFDLFVPLVMADIVNVGIAAHDLHYILVRCGILLVLAVIGLTCSLTAQHFSAKAAVGFGAALGSISPWAVVACSLVTNALAVVLGWFFGNKAAQKIPFNLSWVSGAILIMLAISKLF